MIIMMAAALTAATAQPTAAPATPHAQHQPMMPMDGMHKDGMGKGAMADKAMNCPCCKDMAKGHGKTGDHAEHKPSN